MDDKAYANQCVREMVNPVTKSTSSGIVISPFKTQNNKDGIFGSN